MTNTALQALTARIAVEAPTWTVLRLRYQPSVLWVRIPGVGDRYVVNELALSRLLTAWVLGR